MENALEVTSSPAAGHAIALLSNYSFDLGSFTPEQLVGYWVNLYPPNWVRLAVIESLYQGRYKAISVEQILAFWQRRGRPLYHFGNDFERIICSRFSGTDLALEGEAEAPDKPLAYSVRQSQQQANQDLTRFPQGSLREAGAGPVRLMGTRIEPWHTPTAIAPPFPPVRRLPAPTLERQLSSLSHPPTARTELAIAAKSEERHGEANPVSHAPIHQFVPSQSPSDLDQKLRAAVQMREEFGRFETTLAALRSRVNMPSGGE